MKRSVVLILILISTPSLCAKHYSDDGLYGSFGFSYMTSNSKSGDNERSLETFLQQYKLGYNGIIYSPRLLRYRLEGILNYQNKNTVNNASESKTKIDSRDYKVDLDFLQSSKFPFRIFAQKGESPVSTTSTNSVSSSLSNSQSLGISGSVKLNIFDLSYNASNNSGTNESALIKQDRDTKKYGVSIKKQENTYDYKLEYDNTNQVSQREPIDGTKTVVSDEKDDINFLYNLKISDTINLKTRSRYTNNNYSSANTVSTYAIASANADLRWDPKTKHNGSVSVQVFNMTGDGYTTDSISISQNYGYKILNNLSFNQNSNYNAVNSGSSSSQRIGLGSGLGYSKIIRNENPRVSLSANTNVSTESNSNNTGTSSDTTKYSYGGSMRAVQKFNSLNSELNMDTKYNGQNSSYGSDSERYGATLSLSTTLLSKVKNRLSVSYDEEKSTMVYSNKSYTREISRIYINDNINYSTRIGIKGSLNINAGISYSYIVNDSDVVTRIFPTSGANFNYNIGRKWAFNSSLNVDKDLIYDTMTIRSNSGLIFSGRNTKIFFGYNYNNMTSSINNQTLTSDTQSLRATFTRTF